MSNLNKTTFEIKWSVNDGYVGKDRPQYLVVDVEDEMDKEDWDAMTDEEKHNFLEERVQDAFDQEISFEIEDIQ